MTSVYVISVDIHKSNSHKFPVPFLEVMRQRPETLFTTADKALEAD